MKILITTPYYYPYVGGMENYVRAIADGLHREGVEVVVACGDHVAKVTRETLDGYTVYRLPIWKTFSNTPVNPGWFGMLRRIIQEEQPEIINTHLPVPSMADVTIWAAGRTPVVVTYHAATLQKPGSLLMKLATAAYTLAQRITFAKATAIIAVSPYVKTALGRRLAAKTHVVCNAVAATAISPSIPAGKQGLVFVNNLFTSHAWKGLDLILESLALYRQRYGTAPTLTIVGDGDDRPRYEQKTRDLGLSQTVVFAGRRTGLDRDRLIAGAAGMILYPTTANDAFPTVMLEAWSQGTPVIVSAIGPMPSLVDDGITGLVTAPHDPAALATSIHRLLSDPAAAAAMGHAGHQLVKDHYTWDIQVANTRRLLEKLA